MDIISSNSQDFLLAVLFQLLFQLPLIAVYITGIVISFVKSDKYPKISRLSGIGFGLLLLLSIFSSIFSILPPYFTNWKYDINTISYVLGIIGFTMTLISAGAAALLINAIWKDRL